MRPCTNVNIPISSQGDELSQLDIVPRTHDIPNIVSDGVLVGNKSIQVNGVALGEHDTQSKGMTLAMACREKYRSVKVFQVSICGIINKRKSE
jgi:hypothetical protein